MKVLSIIIITWLVCFAISMADLAFIMVRSNGRKPSKVSASIMEDFIAAPLVALVIVAVRIFDLFEYINGKRWKNK